MHECDSSSSPQPLRRSRPRRNAYRNEPPVAQSRCALHDRRGLQQARAQRDRKGDEGHSVRQLHSLQEAEHRDSLRGDLAWERVPSSGGLHRATFEALPRLRVHLGCAGPPRVAARARILPRAHQAGQGRVRLHFQRQHKRSLHQQLPEDVGGEGDDVRPAIRLPVGAALPRPGVRDRPHPEDPGAQGVGGRGGDRKGGGAVQDGRPEAEQALPLPQAQQAPRLSRGGGGIRAHGARGQLHHCVHHRRDLLKQPLLRCFSLHPVS
ncbi:hypothetical protein CEXT_513871 [Caerostris extrusa]|uniref:Uncharacterized protein n=1 Tax=Caerostris extrusa TaxID=172846 RepID=A0AAV4UWW3_CAEEX|nr:hypothetical protein CEXT_513871 [Caerostris extrusa]